VKRVPLVSNEMLIGTPQQARKRGHRFFFLFSWRVFLASNPLNRHDNPMIYQCYFDASQQARLFDSPLYRGFGLYKAVNPAIARNCPELADPKNQHALSEYGAMLHLWRNADLDPDPWIGFTSYRQLDKFPTVFQDRRPLEAALADADVAGWGFYQFFEAPTGRPITLAEQRERCHPGITSFLWQLLRRRRTPGGQTRRASQESILLRCSFSNLMAKFRPLGPGRDG
jgi:hypothetical protein